MIAIDDVLLSDDIVKAKFVCDLDACHGACCWEGDGGAPLLEEEVDIIASVWDKVSPLLSEESRKTVAKNGFSAYYGDDGELLGTPLVKKGPCAYLIWDGKGIGKCAFEQAFEKGIIDWPKPLSCHLYPIRVKYLKNGTEAWNYSRWSICAPACKNGKKLSVPLYKFLKGAIVRAKGKAFYKMLEACAEGFE
ncbi:MAG: DUF3109 family protein [Saprospiraceae bacterium]